MNAHICFSVSSALGYIVLIAIVWNIPYVRGILSPFKLLTVALHESSHACCAWGTCGHVDSIDIDAMVSTTHDC